MDGSMRPRCDNGLAKIRERGRSRECAGQPLDDSVSGKRGTAGQGTLEANRREGDSGGAGDDEDLNRRRGERPVEKIKETAIQFAKGEPKNPNRIGPL